MKFKINNTEWEIKEINNVEIQGRFELKNDEFVHGLTIYSENIVYLNKDSGNKTRTLKHELTHVWLYEYGHNQQEKEFNYEDVCEIVASSNNFINEVVEQYQYENGADEIKQEQQNLIKKIKNAGTVLLNEH